MLACFVQTGQLCLRTTHLHSLSSSMNTVSASLGLVSAQFEIAPFEPGNLDPDNLHFAEKEFEEAESSDSDDHNLMTIKNIARKESQVTCLSSDSEDIPLICIKRKGSLRTLRLKGDDARYDSSESLSDISLVTRSTIRTMYQLKALNTLLCFQRKSNTTLRLYLP